MAKKEETHKLVLAICEALGVDPDKTRGIDIRIRPASIDPGMISVYVGMDAWALESVDWSRLAVQRAIGVHTVDTGTLDTDGETKPEEAT